MERETVEMKRERTRERERGGLTKQQYLFSMIFIVMLKFKTFQLEWTTYTICSLPLVFHSTTPLYFYTCILKSEILSHRYIGYRWCSIEWNCRKIGKWSNAYRERERKNEQVEWKNKKRNVRKIRIAVNVNGIDEKQECKRVASALLCLSQSMIAQFVFSLFFSSSFSSSFSPVFSFHHHRLSLFSPFRTELYTCMH